MNQRTGLPQMELLFPALWWGYLHWWQRKGVVLTAENRSKFWWGLRKSGINWRWTGVTDALNYCPYSLGFSRHVHITQEHSISPPTEIAYVQKFLLQLLTLLPGTLIFLWTVYVMNFTDISSPTDFKVVFHLPNKQQDPFCSNHGALQVKENKKWYKKGTSWKNWWIFRPA